MKLDIHQANLNGEQLRIAIVVSRFNQAIGDALLKSCTDELERLGVTEDDVVIISVAGALEIPLALRKLAQIGNFNALIALGAVIRGDTYHFEIVANEMAAGISRLTLDADLPIANGVLTCETEAQAQTRAFDKGRDCAQIAVEMANLGFDLTPPNLEEDIDENDENNENDENDENDENFNDGNNVDDGDNQPQKEPATPSQEQGQSFVGLAKNINKSAVMESPL